jgi:hypoxanthine phosphoribosyltransferase
MISLVNTPLGLISELEQVLLSAADIHARLLEMAADIRRELGPLLAKSASAAGEPVGVLTVVGIMDGALFFIADLLRELRLPTRLITLSASSYHGGVQSSGQVKFDWPAGLDLTGAHILVLDDILDTGLTLQTVLDPIRSQRPASLHSAVLLKKRGAQRYPTTADYCGFEIEDVFLVGYGLDYRGRFRNLPCIGTLSAELL